MILHRPALSIAFLLGAGFNVDASFVANSLPIQHYPLISDLGKACFGLDRLPPEKSIEELFQEAIDSKNRAPLEKFYDLLMEADYYLTPHLSQGGSEQNNAYLRMLQDFPSAPILTFNYDSLVEILLLKLNHWRPEDGYGVPVYADLFSPQGSSITLPESSLRPVLHLHGTLCVYPSSFTIESKIDQRLDMLRPKNEPDFIFDPDAIANCFLPFQRILPGPNFHHPAERVIAPVPSKAYGLLGEFVTRIHNRGVEIFQSTRTIVVIGYSFNPLDGDSYVRLLEAARGAKIILVVPEARNLASRLCKEHPEIEWQAVSTTFREWVAQDYQGIRNLGI